MRVRDEGVSKVDEFGVDPSDDDVQNARSATRSFIHSFNHSFIHSFIHSFYNPTLFASSTKRLGPHPPECGQISLDELC